MDSLRLILSLLTALLALALTGAGDEGFDNRTGNKVFLRTERRSNTQAAFGSQASIIRREWHKGKGFLRSGLHVLNAFQCEGRLYSQFGYRNLRHQHLQIYTYQMAGQAIAGNVSAIRCFQCNSYVDDGCDSLTVNDTSSPYYKECATTVESGGRELFCRKTVQLILDADFMHTRIIRSCGWVKHPKYHCYDFKNKGHEDISCTCYHDGCNSAPVSAPTAASALALAVFSSLRLLM